MSDLILKILSKPDKCDFIVFGDLFMGEVWFVKEIVENNEQQISIQWEPEPELLDFLWRNPKGALHLDKETGKTVTKKYPKLRAFYRIGEKRWMIFTDWIGKEHVNFNLDERIIERNGILEMENRQLRNEIGFLYSELERTNTRLDEQIESWSKRFKIVGSIRGDLPPEMSPDQPQANYMGENG